MCDSSNSKTTFHGGIMGPPSPLTGSQCLANTFIFEPLQTSFLFKNIGWHSNQTYLKCRGYIDFYIQSISLNLFFLLCASNRIFLHVWAPSAGMPLGCQDDRDKHIFGALHHCMHGATRRWGYGYFSALHHCSCNKTMGLWIFFALHHCMGQQDDGVMDIFVHSTTAAATRR